MTIEFQQFTASKFEMDKLYCHLRFCCV